MDKKQTIGVGIIVRDSEKTIGKCLESLAPYVDQMVVVYAGKSTDKTEEEVEKVKSKYPIISTYPFTWIDDFAAARNFSFSKLTTEWYLWCDGDDIVTGAENLRKAAETMPPEVGFVWYPYNYAQDEYGNIITLYERERLLRAAYGWVWKGRLHETVVGMTQSKYVRLQDVVFVHSHLAGAPRGDRNFKLLALMLKEEPENKRMWLYMGHQHFAGRDMTKAAEWYLKFASSDAIPLERYQALCYAAKALIEIKDMQQAINTCLSAIELFPSYVDAYIELARCYLFLGQWDKVIQWVKFSYQKDLITEPPHVIFINPLDYSFTRPSLMVEAYFQQQNYDEALKWLLEANKVRPVTNQIDAIQDIKKRVDIINGIKLQAIHLLENKELLKLRDFLEVTPYWFKELPDYQELKGGVLHHTKDLKDDVKIENGIADLSSCIDIDKVLKTLDSKIASKEIKSGKVLCPIPGVIRTLSRMDIEEKLQGRRVINLQESEEGVLCEYDLAKPEVLVRMYCGQGLEFWNPTTIKEVGCGGSETSAAYVCKEFARDGKAYTFLYGMDNQTWDGVVYRTYNNYNPGTPPCNIFIASRIPELIDQEIPAFQKWLWVHDTDCGDRLTPERAEKFDAIIALTKWHAGHLKRVYPFLKDCEIVDGDNLPLLYEDSYTRATFFKEAKCRKLPVLAIIGDGIDTERFSYPTDKIPHSFLWSSAPDRGLLEVLTLWSKIKEALPDATLKIFYGWGYYDRSLGFPGQRELKSKILELLKQEGVEWVGRVGQTKLAEVMAHTQCLLYPPHPFRETCFITGLEAQASKMITFYRENGALGETVGDRGIPLKMDSTPEEIVSTITRVLQDKELYDKILNRGREYAMTQRDWRHQVEKMRGLYEFIEKRIEGK